MKAYSQNLSLVILAACLVLVCVDAVCTVPPPLCDTDPTNPDCFCARPISVGFDPADPFATGVGCPSCPAKTGSCPDLIPSNRQKVFVCHRRHADDVDDEEEVISYEMIEVNANSLNAHLRHGDFIPTADTCCTCDLNLCSARKRTIQTRSDAFKIWLNETASKTELLNAFVSVMTTITADNYTVIEPSLSATAYTPRADALNYDVITTSYLNVFNIVHQEGFKFVWSNNGTVLKLTTCDRYLVPPQSLSMSMYSGVLTFHFLANSPKYHLLEIESACPFLAPNPAPSTTDIFQICYTLDFVCGSFPGSQYEFTGNVTGCISFWSRLALKQQAIIDRQCNYNLPKSADTSECRQTLFLLALVDPVRHCQHVNQVSSTCKDVATDFPGTTCPFYTGPPPQ